MTAHLGFAAGLEPVEGRQRANRAAVAYGSPRSGSATGAVLSAGLHATAVALIMGAFGDAQGPQRPGALVATVTLITAGTFEAAGSRAPALPPGGSDAPAPPWVVIAAQDAAPAPKAGPAAPPAAPLAQASPPWPAADATPRVSADAGRPLEITRGEGMDGREAERLRASADTDLQFANPSQPEIAAATHAPVPPSRPRKTAAPMTPNAARVTSDAPVKTAALPTLPTLSQAASAPGDGARGSTQRGAEPSNRSTQDRAGHAEDSMVRSRYRAEISRRIERAKRAGSGGEGDGAALVELTIDASGGLLGATLAESSGLAMRDAAALSTVRRAAPFPAPPPELAKDRLVLRVRFR